MNTPTRTGTYKKYKGKYFVVFYDKTGEDFKYAFDNVREILQFQGKEITRQNVNLVNVELYRALRSENHLTTFLTGKTLSVWIIDEEDEFDDIVVDYKEETNKEEMK